MQRKFVSLIVGLVTCICSVAAGANVPAKPEASGRPNVVVIVADDHGTDAIGAYGNRIVRTPAIDALARDGVRFDRAFSTVSSCSPSRATILTGRQTHTNGMYGLQQVVHHFQSFDDELSLPVALENAGYRTARIGKYHVAPDSVFRFGKNLGAGKKAQRGELGRSPVEMADLSNGFISADGPFFLYFATMDPHRSAPHGKVNRFGNRDDGFADTPTVTYRPEDVVVPAFLPDIPAVRAELAQYYQSVSRVDAGVARLIAHLKAAGKYDNTLILYLSDNGVAFPGAKTTLYEPGMRLPLIVKLPGGGRAGDTEKAMVSWVDLMPTVLDYAGVRVPGSVSDKDTEGRSFRGLLDMTAYKPRQAIYASQTFHEIQMYYPMRVLHEQRYKLIWNIASPLPVRQAVDLKNSATWLAIGDKPNARYGERPVASLLKRPEYELYDLQNDPNETRNLAKDPAMRKRLEEMKAKLVKFLDETGDPWSPNWMGRGE
ncbi:sulfatase [Novosphingobium aquae]|uniref:Sulfatase n=1 Tax=Novosphingobium aquae TaxID=3133435 RepID=A0ABU8SB56_9SPHN